MLRFFCLITLAVFSHIACAWEDHAILTSTVLQQWKAKDRSVARRMELSVRAESLQAFLEATKTSLPQKLLDIERYAASNIVGYKPLPKALLYKPEEMDCANQLDVCFRKAVRMNLDVPLPLIVYDPSHVYARKHGYFSVSDPSQLMPAYVPVTFQWNNFTLIPEMGSVKAADVIATASMQPDFGFDVFLYEDSNTEFGKIFGFGTQPVGSPLMPFHSQMLFHMSTMQDDPRILTFMPRLNENYVEYRAYAYLSLSRFAAEEGHPYWALTFLGWGLHYIQDLTQPYHTRLAYGLDPNAVLQSLAEMARQNYAPFLELQTIQTNRHMLMENLTREILVSEAETEVYKDLLQASLSDRRADSMLYSCDFRDLHHHFKRSNSLDYQAILQTTLPSYYVNSPHFHAEEKKDFHGLFMKEMTKSQRLRLSEGIAEALRQYGGYTRACVEMYAKTRG